MTLWANRAAYFAAGAAIVGAFAAFAHACHIAGAP